MVTTIVVMSFAPGGVARAAHGRGRVTGFVAPVSSAPLAMTMTKFRCRPATAAGRLGKTVP